MLDPASLVDVVMPRVFVIHPTPTGHGVKRSSGSAVRLAETTLRSALGFQDAAAARRAGDGHSTVDVVSQRGGQTLRMAQEEGRGPS